LVVPIEKASINIIRNVFMKIEEPAVVTQENNLSFQRAFDFMDRQKYTKEESCPSKPRNVVKPANPGDDDEYFPCLDPEFKKEFRTGKVY
jgi:hypothetical protein